MTTPAAHTLLNYSGKCVLISGAGGGIGRGIALRFAEAGANIVIHCHSRAEDGQRTAADIARSGATGSAVSVQADLTQPEGAARLVAAGMSSYGRVDALINNAGAYPLDSLVDMDVAQWRAVLDANLTSAMLATQSFAQHAEPQSAVVNITSIEAFHPAPAHSHYGAAKAALEMFTRSSAFELAPRGIRVNAVAPGLIWRDGIDEAWPDGVLRWRAKAPLGRLGDAADVADACLFLASPAARWITGVSLTVDGGLSASPLF